MGYTILMPGYSARSGRIMLIKNVFIREAYRAIGLGRVMFGGIAKYGLQHGYAFEEHHVQSWNESAVKFYKRLGAEDLSISEGCAYLRIQVSDPLKLV